MPQKTVSHARRRAALARLAVGALVLAGGAACGFSPVYGPAGAASRLTGAVALAPPESRAAYLYNRRIEDRLGRAGDARFLLVPEIDIDEVDLGETSTGSTTRKRLDGQVSYRLSDPATGETLALRRTDAFTGYSTTGPNVSTRASEVDALERLMTILADQTVDQLLLESPDLPAVAAP